MTEQLAEETIEDPVVEKPKEEYDFRRKMINYFIEFDCFFIIGNKRWGKTTFMEWLAEKFKKKGYLIIDLTDAGDFESAMWGIRDCKICHGAVRYDQEVCPKCKIAPKPAYQVLLLVPAYVECSILDPNFKLFIVEEGDKYAFKNAVTMAIKEKRVLSLASGLFETNHLYKCLTEWFYQWLQLNRDTFRVNTCILLREAADTAFSRGKTQETKYQTKLKGALINLIRKAGHYRTVILFDSQRFMGLDIGVRGNIPNIIVKRHSHHNQPDVVKLLNSKIENERWEWYEEKVHPDLINMRRPEVTYLRKHEFYVQFDDGEYELLKNGFPSFHHKGEYDYFASIADMGFKQELFSIEDEKEINIKTVSKSALLPVAFQLYDEWGLTEKDLSRIFGRKETTMKSWIKEAKG